MLDTLFHFVVHTLDRITPLLALAAVYLGGVISGWYAHRCRVYAKLWFADFHEYRRAKRTVADRLRELGEEGGRH